MQRELKSENRVSDFEELILLAVLRLRDDAYGVSVLDTLEEVTKRPVTVGALYAALDRMQNKGFIESWLGESTPERGGRAKKYYRVTGLGEQALDEAERLRRTLRSGVRKLKPIGGFV